MGSSKCGVTRTRVVIGFEGIWSFFSQENSELLTPFLNTHSGVEYLPFEW